MCPKKEKEEFGQETKQVKSNKSIVVVKQLYIHRDLHHRQVP